MFMNDDYISNCLIESDVPLCRKLLVCAPGNIYKKKIPTNGHISSAADYSTGSRFMQPSLPILLAPLNDQLAESGTITDPSERHQHSCPRQLN